MAVTLDRDTVLKGMAAAIIVCLPLALLADALSDEREPGWWVFALYAAVLAGFGLGGFVAARTAPDSPYTNGAVAAVAAFVVVQAVGIVVRLAADESIQYVPVAFNALLAYGSGLTGAVAGARNVPRP